MSSVEGGIQFEAFELAPSNKAAMSTKGRLRRPFPGSSCSIPQQIFLEEGFIETLSAIAAKLSAQPGPETKPRISKAGQMHEEDRDTTEPKLVTEYMMSFLKAAGQAGQTSTLWKNTREEVLLSKCRLPWRRTPLWLLLRVTLQSICSRSGLLTSNRSLYKVFMAFCLAYVLERYHDSSITSELLHMMIAKISQRLLKLDNSVTKLYAKAIATIGRGVAKTQSIIQSRWKRLIHQDALRLDLTKLQSLQIDDATCYDFPEVCQFLASLTTRCRIAKSCNFVPKGLLPRYAPSILPSNLFSLAHDCRSFELAAFETWVESHLDEWLSHHVGDQTTCDRLWKLMKTYYDVANKHYAGNPETLSQMLLTVMELWIACDKSACALNELLNEYSPKVSPSLLYSLNLRFRSQMGRLAKIETHMETRRRSFKSVSDIFVNFGERLDFSVRSFDRSTEHQSILSQIREFIAHKQAEKCQELESKKQRYSGLIRQHDTCDHEYVNVLIEDTDQYELRHHTQCKKCSYKREAEAITIDVFERPISDDADAAKATVFELNLPLSFAAWRDATVFLLDDVLQGACHVQTAPTSKHLLLQYQGLSRFHDHCTANDRRINLLSEVKPHIKTHRRQKHISHMTKDDVCLRNGLQLRYYDKEKDRFLSPVHVTNKILKTCTYKVPSNSSSLQKFLVRSPSEPSGLAPNEAMASQAGCPSEMSLDEFRSFCTLPLGNQIQWLNLLRQLVCPSLDFTKVETNLLICQILYQAGPPHQGAIERANHAIVNVEGFSGAILAQLYFALRRVSENWDASLAVACLISISARLLSLVATQAARDQCIGFLEEARAIVFRWIRTLLENAHSIRNNAHRQEVLSKVVETTLIGTRTFDLEQEILSRILSCPSQAALWIQMSIVLQEFCPAASSQQSQLQPVLLERWKRLSYRVLPSLTKEITEAQNCCLDDAIKESWAAYESGDAWQTVAAPHEHWLCSQTMRQEGSNAMEVHFNLLTAELLIDGRPLARLPRAYETQPIYSTLFGTAALEIMPSSLPGMEFSAKKDCFGHIVHLGIQDLPSGPAASSSDLLVHTHCEGRTYDLVPSRLFRGRVPTAFVDKYIHWYDHAADTVEFRPATDPWSRSSLHWHLKRVSGKGWCLSRDDVFLLGLQSEVTKTLSSPLLCLENLTHIHLFYKPGSDLVELDLPRIKLGFDFIPRTSAIESRQFRGMYIDPAQNADTLIGLKPKLLLRSHHSLSDRVMLIPEGPFRHRSERGHVIVDVDKDSICKIHAYSLDLILRRITDSGTLQSKLLLCYLHALTSYCLPDSWTEHSGTEQALSILKSAAVKSFPRLGIDNKSLLQEIAKLTPTRAYYPRHLRDMQEISWDPNIGYLNQHSNFHSLVSEIFEQAKAAKMFYPGESLYSSMTLDTTMDCFLLERDLIRSSTFRNANSGAELFTTKFDVEHTARDRGVNSEASRGVYAAATCILRDQRALFQHSPHELNSLLWKLFQKCSPIHGCNEQSEYIPPQFDFVWLNDLNKSISWYWCQLHKSFGRSQSQNKFRIAAFLSAMAFANPSRMDLIQLFASLYLFSVISQIKVPSSSSFSLDRGIKPIKEELLSSVRLYGRAFHDCPEVHLPKNENESKAAARERRHKQHRQIQNQEIENFVGLLMSQWPCESPSRPDGGKLQTYIDIWEAHEKVKVSFRMWFTNLKFKEYLDSIATVLQKQRVQPIQKLVDILDASRYVPRIQRRFVSISDAFSGPAPMIGEKTDTVICDLLKDTAADRQISSQLSDMISDLANLATSNYEKLYATELEESLTSLVAYPTQKLLSVPKTQLRAAVDQHLSNCEAKVRSIWSTLVGSVQCRDESSGSIAATAGKIPRLSITFFLQQLNRTHWKQLSPAWKRCIVGYGVAITQLQHAIRINKLVNFDEELINELGNVAHRNWSPYEFPETLLFEIENGIIVRERQESIACQMRDPPKLSNAVMQLNMGEGKSTVIVPTVAAALADGTRLVRVIVAKPQSKQMLEILISKLGGMLDRRIYHMPISRSLKFDIGDANALRAICKDCVNNGGVLLVHPEHMLSLKLMSLDRIMAGDEQVGSSLLDLQRFFGECARDVIDESDENFAVKFELVYTIGMQRPMELSPDRWVIAQKVLQIFATVAMRIKDDLPQSLEVEDQGEERFPRIRIFDPTADDRIIKETAEGVCRTTFPGCPIAHQLPELRDAIMVYISKADLVVDEIERVEGNHISDSWTEVTKAPLLLLRGLLAGGILSFVFASKRWRVNYGLDPSRDPPTRLAVPFRAKDNPTQRSEFSHPDVAITLTLLSYYYGGLQDGDLFTAFAQLYRSDQGQVEYEHWIENVTALPRAFHQLTGVNIKDEVQCREKVFPYLRYSVGAINYFLSHFVFAKEMKEFPHKISASGWDIGELKKHAASGFSGTNDSRHVLPLSVKQLDLPAQRHTNALVLEYLLRKENSVHLLSRSNGSTRNDTDMILEAVDVIEPPPRVILDVGAQVLELSNHQFAEKWLRLQAGSDEVKAVVFFDDNDELSVLDRSNFVEPLQTSPFAKQLGSCLVFLDEAHTRGTDLKLPSDYRAAVTLGANLTKDKLVQGT